jgi:hypothetical protein
MEVLAKLLGQEELVDSALAWKKILAVRALGKIEVLAGLNQISNQSNRS